MLLTEYNEAEAMELFRMDGIREGLEEGRQEERADGLRAIVQSLREYVHDFEPLYRAISKMPDGFKIKPFLRVRGASRGAEQSLEFLL